MTLADETLAYQAYLEAHRAAREAQDDYSLDSDSRPDDRMVAQLAEDLTKAEAAMTRAWRDHHRLSLP